MKGLKENWVLYAGISLPLFITAIFFIATQIDKASIHPPRHSVVFATNYEHNNTNNPYRLLVKDHQIYFKYFPLGKENSYRNWVKPRLFIYNPMKDSQQEIELPTIEDLSTKVDMLVEGFSSNKVSVLKASPDGYIFDTHYRDNANIMTVLFGGGSRSRSEIFLTKEAHSVRIPDSRRYNSYFIGWLIDMEQ